jgi:hypothetical protein
MTETTALDQAHAEAETSDAARLRYFAVLADTELYLLLEREAGEEAVEPRLFPVEGGEVALAFDTEARLADFAGDTVAYAALPGRVLAELLGSQGLGLGLNLEVALSATILPPEALRWLTQTLGGEEPGETDRRISRLDPPGALPGELLRALGDRLTRSVGLAERALLAKVAYRDGGSGHLLAIVGARAQSHPALARAVNEALTFSGIEAGVLDLAFFDAGHPVVVRLDRVAMRFDIPAPSEPRPVTPAAPGMDPDRPPKLR